MGNLCVFHVALDYFCRALLPQSLWHYLIESFSLKFISVLFGLLSIIWKVSCIHWILSN
jgi:hypothetical protein